MDGAGNYSRLYITLIKYMYWTVAGHFGKINLKIKQAHTKGGKKMSSFTISKREYMKAAGFCAGLASCKNHYREDALRIWCDKLGKVAGDEEYKKTFEALYKWNAESVKKQYNDPEAEKDENEYTADFLKAKAKAKKIYTFRGCSIDTRDELKIMIFGFHHFACSVLYQIEAEEERKKAARVLGNIEHHLMSTLAEFSINHDDMLEYWGSFGEDETA